MLSLTGKNVASTLGSKLKASAALGKLEITSFQQARTLKHHDIKVPNFDDSRHPAKLNPETMGKKDSLDGAKVFAYGVYTATMSAGLIAAKATVKGIVDYLGPNMSAFDSAILEVPMSDIAMGQSLTFVWQGSPLFIRHRTPEQIKIEESVDVSKLRDPQSDDERVVDKNFLVVLGICTHLGCVPLHSAGMYGGYYCPCHGSHYDYAGRIRHGPAPLNLKVPNHRFEDGNIFIG